MDLSGATLCMLCANAMLGEQPKTELLCGHFFHTECLILHWYDQEMCCPSCHMNVFNAQIRTAATTREQATRDKREQTFSEEYIQNKELRLDIKTIKKHIASTRRARSRVTMFGNQKRREWNEESKPLVDLLKVKQKEMMRSLQMCPELKTWKSERLKLTRIVNQFERKYTHHTFRALQNYTFLKLPSHWDYRSLTALPRWRIGRYFHIRV
jgi:hypothetical protein